MNEKNTRYFCFMCDGKFDEADVLESGHGHICKQCRHYRILARIIGFTIMGIVFLIINSTLLTYLEYGLWELNNFDFYDSGAALRVKLFSGGSRALTFIILFFITSNIVNSVTRSLSRNKYKQMGYMFGVTDVPLPVQAEKLTETDIMNTYIWQSSDQSSFSEKEIDIVNFYRYAPDNIREEVLMILSLEPTPEKKKEKYKKYSYQEVSIMLNFRNSSKAIQNKVLEKLQEKQ